MEAPPSFTSLMPKNSDDDNQPKVSQFEEDQYYNPSMSKLRSYSSFEDQNRAIVQPAGTYDDGVQAISIGAMAVRGKEVQIPDQRLTEGSNEQAPSMGNMGNGRGYSQPAGGDFSYNAPPSHGDMARRDESVTGGSGGGGENVLEGNYEGMSLTGRDFARLYPTMFQ